MTTDLAGTVVGTRSAAGSRTMTVPPNKWPHCNSVCSASVTTTGRAPARSFESVTNIGVRPTLYENYALTIESHIFDFDSNVYGDVIRLYFHQLLRRERQFRSALELNDQIHSDIGRSRRFFARHPIRFNEIGIQQPK